MGAPSVRVIAAQLTLTALNGCPEVTRDTMTDLFQSRVSEAKAEKVVTTLDKLNAKHIARMQKIVQKYHDAEAARASGAKKATGKPFPKKK